MKVEIWADVVCPWCYIGKRRFERALEAFPHRDDVEVVHRSFQLDPAAPARRTEPTVERLAHKYGTSVEQARAMMRRVERTAAEEGLEYDLAKTLSGNTFDAHRVLHLAKEKGRQDEVIERFYRAYFTERESVFDHESLVRLAAEAGLDPDEARRVLEEGTYGDAVRADAAEAAALGVQGVPFFVIDRRYGVSGAQPTELFEQALARAWAEAQPLTRLESADGPVCEDDTCAVPAEAADTPDVADAAGARRA